MYSVLIIEADSEKRERIVTILELASYQVWVACDGKEGYEKAMELHPDLILSDVNLPTLDGFGILKLLMTRPEMISIPLIFLTGNVEREDIRRGMELGAADYITEPYTESELLNAVEAQIEKVERLKNHTSLLANVNRTQFNNRKEKLDTLFKHKIVNKYKKNQYIFTEGNHPLYLFYVLSGKIKAFKTNEDGKDLTVGLYNAGDFMGYTALLEDDKYSVTTMAIEASEIALIPREEFFELVSNHSSIAILFIRLLAKNNNHKAAQMVQLAYDSLRKRVASTLLFLKDKFDKQDKDKFILDINRTELANLSGTTKESLIRTLSDFHTEKIISIDHGKIEILDESKLKYMLN